MNLRHFIVTFQLVEDLLAALRKKQPHLLENFRLHSDNAPSHRAMHTQDILKQLGIRTVEHPPYSPDLAMCDFWLTCLKDRLRGQHHNNRNELVYAV